MNQSKLVKKKSNENSHNNDRYIFSIYKSIYRYLYKKYISGNKNIPAEQYIVPKYIIPYKTILYKFISDKRYLHEYIVTKKSSTMLALLAKERRYLLAKHLLAKKRRYQNRYKKKSTTLTLPLFFEYFQKQSRKKKIIRKWITKFKKKWKVNMVILLGLHLFSDQGKKKSTQKFKKKSISKSKDLPFYSKLHELQQIDIGLASTKSIKKWSEKTLPNGKMIGKITNANTLHHKTLKPQKGGLFCERIFGPLKDFECACGKKRKPPEERIKEITEQEKIEKKSKHEKKIEAKIKNIEQIIELQENTIAIEKKLLNPNKRQFCEQCEVEYTWSVIRRYQLGYIQLVSPVIHAWYLKGNSSYLNLLLGIEKKKELEIIISASQILTLEYSQTLTEQNFNSPEKLFQIWKKSMMNLDKSKPKQKIKSQNNKNTKKLHSDESFLLNIPDVSKTDYNVIKTFSLNKYSLLTHEEITNFQLKIQTIKAKRWKPWRSELIKFNNIIFFNETINESYKISKTVKYKNKPIIPVMIYIVNKIEFFSTKKTIIVIKEKLFKEFYMQLFVWIYKKITTYKKFKFILQDKNTRNFGIGLIQNMIDKFFSFDKVKTLFNTETFLTKKFFCVQKNYYNLIQYYFDDKYFEKTYSLKNNNHKFKLFTKFLNSIEPELKTIVQKVQKNKLNLHFFLNNIIVNAVDPNIINSSNLLLNYNKTTLITYTNNHFNFLNFLNSIKKIITVQSFFKLKNKINNFDSKKLAVNVVDPNFTIQKYLYLQTDSIAIMLSNCISNMFLKGIKKEGIKNCFQRIFKSIVQYRQYNIEQYVSIIKLKVKKKFCVNNFSRSPKVVIVNKFKPHEIIYSTKFINKNKLYDFYLKYFWFKNREKSNFSFNKPITNNIYYLSSQERWKSERLWKKMLGYIQSVPDLTDIPIFHYKWRIRTSQNVVNGNGLTGTFLLQKYLEEFSLTEMEKMNRQNEFLFYTLNLELSNCKERLKKAKENKNSLQKNLAKLEHKELLEEREPLIRQIKLIHKLVQNKTYPQHMILSVIPVLPPDLRPILKMGEQIVVSDLNRLYQRVIYRNERLQKFLKDPALMNSYEMKYAQRLLQQAVDNLIQNANNGLTSEKDSNGRLLKSLSDILKGKQGRFRQHLLGKRIDYSGRSVIIVGPKLKLHECGLPKEMALELFLPFLIKKIISLKLAITVIGAKTFIKKQKEMTYDILKEIMNNHPILLNRAPTLHRLGIQSFQPKLVDGRAILLHPLVCPAFNADFDGDQMAVHIPITFESRVEAWKLMFSQTNLLSPATGEPIALPSQDMVLGCYYLTTEKCKAHLTSNIYFSNLRQVLKAYDQGKINLHTVVWVRYDAVVETGKDEEEPLEIRVNKNGFWQEINKTSLITYDFKGKQKNQFIQTTPGRVLFNEFINDSIF